MDQDTIGIDRVDGDLLGSDDPPWRPSRRSVALVVSAALVVAGGLAWTGYRDRQAVLDRTAVAAVSFTVSRPLDPRPGPDLTVRLNNYSPDAVRVDRVRFAEVHAAATVGTLLPRGGTFDLVLPRATCPQSWVDYAFGTLVLDVRTARGSRAQVTTNLGEDLLVDYNDTTRRRCGLEPPEQVLMAGAEVQRTHPDRLEEVVSVRNNGTSAFTLTDLDSGVFTATGGRLPVTVEPGRTVVEHLTLRVRDCDPLLRNGTDGTEVSFSVTGRVPGTVTAFGSAAVAYQLAELATRVCGQPVLTRNY